MEDVSLKNGNIIRNPNLKSELVQYWMKLGNKYLYLYSMHHYDKDGLHIDEAIVKADEVFYKNTGVNVDREYKIAGIPRMDNCYADIMVTMVVNDVDKLLLWRMSQ